MLLLINQVQFIVENEEVSFFKISEYFLLIENALEFSNHNHYFLQLSMIGVEKLYPGVHPKWKGH
jgi:hypothetical protein